MSKMYQFKHIITIFLCIFLMLGLCLGVFASESAKEPEPGDILAKQTGSLELACKSAILMDAATGEVLYEQNADEPLPPASVTKVMTLLLVMEAIDREQIHWQDSVCVSAHAASMGGSQVFLKEGETMTVEDLVKSVVVSSANDAAVALAEFVAGSEEAFVAGMNQRAAELGMKTAHFENTNGLDDSASASSHVLSARDIAIMSRELISHKDIFKYTTIWMDTIRDGAFGLTNTNRLIRFYKGATGLKTGSTSKAKFCISATAKRDNLHLVCVIMGAETRDIRNSVAASLLDYGFANYSLYSAPETTRGQIKVLGGVKDSCLVSSADFSKILAKGKDKKVMQKIEIAENVAAPVKKGDVVGKILFECEGEVVGECPVTATEEISKITFGEFFLRLLAKFALK